MRQRCLGMNNLVNSQVSPRFTPQPVLYRPFRVSKMVVHHILKSWGLVQRDDQSVWANSSCCWWSWDFETLFCDSWPQLQKGLQSTPDPHPWSAWLRRLVCPVYIGFDALLFLGENNIRLSFRPRSIIWKLLSWRREPMIRLALETFGTWAGVHHHGMNTTCTWAPNPVDYGMHSSLEVHLLPQPSSFNLWSFESSG